MQKIDVYEKPYDNLGGLGGSETGQLNGAEDSQIKSTKTDL